MSNKLPSVDALKSQKQTYDSIRPDKLSYRMTKSSAVNNSSLSTKKKG